MIKTFGLQGACASAAVSMAVSTVATHRLSQRYFPVAYDYKRLGWLAGLTGVFYLAGLLTELLPPGFGVVARFILLASFVPLLLASPVFERHEITAARALLSERWATLRIRRTA